MSQDEERRKLAVKYALKLTEIEKGSTCGTLLHHAHEINAYLKDGTTPYPEE